MKEWRSLGGILWEKFEDSENLGHKISQWVGVSEFLGKCLARLEPKFSSPEEVRDFLSPSMRNYYDPYLMKGMAEAAQRLRRAVASQERVRIVTDYDADGTMSSLILQATLRLLGHEALSYHIPHRKTEGYGFSEQAARKAVEDGIGLIVTADIGVRDAAAIHYAQSHGVDVIVLDHHLPEGGGVPEEAHAVVCPPQVGCAYPNPQLAACGISLKLAQAMLSGVRGHEKIIESMSKLAALGTVADVVSLRSIENRAIVATGLAALNGSGRNNPGLSALLSVSKLDGGHIDSSQIAFNLAPKINAAGRMATATHVVELINAANRVQAQALADKLLMMNETRKAIQEKMIERARAHLMPHADKPFLFAAFEESETWQSGIAGIVAGRLKEEFRKTVAIGTIAGGEIVCSVRSTPGVHAVEALNCVAGDLLRYGGHKAAAGFTLSASRFDAVWAGLCESAAAQLCGAPEAMHETYAEDLTADEVTEALFDDLEKLEPCGTQNSRPNVCLKDVTPESAALCKNGSVRCIVKCPEIKLIVWIPAQFGAMQDAWRDRRISLIGTLEKDYFNGRTQYAMRVRDIAV